MQQSGHLLTEVFHLLLQRAVFTLEISRLALRVPKRPVETSLLRRQLLNLPQQVLIGSRHPVIRRLLFDDHPNLLVDVDHVLLHSNLLATELDPLLPQRLLRLHIQRVHLHGRLLHRAGHPASIVRFAAILPLSIGRTCEHLRLVRIHDLFPHRRLLLCQLLRRPYLLLQRQHRLLVLHVHLIHLHLELVHDALQLCRPLGMLLRALPVELRHPLRLLQLLIKALHLVRHVLLQRPQLVIRLLQRPLLLCQTGRQPRLIPLHLLEHLHLLVHLILQRNVLLRRLLPLFIRRHHLPLQLLLQPRVRLLQDGLLLLHLVVVHRRPALLPEHVLQLGVKLPIVLRHAQYLRRQRLDANLQLLGLLLRLFIPPLHRHLAPLQRLGLQPMLLLLGLRLMQRLLQHAQRRLRLPHRRLQRRILLLQRLPGGHRRGQLVHEVRHLFFSRLGRLLRGDRRRLQLRFDLCQLPL
mmetsp:Transcript_4423/g.12527  ORF Transcript_4423/g.12527 Transcript_4423/m.12527 type:complete len:465 (+) Transcript_4423:4798-6192(+)